MNFDFLKVWWADFAAWVNTLFGSLVSTVTRFFAAMTAAIGLAWSLFLVVLEIVDVGAAFQSIADVMNSAAGVVRALPVAGVMAQLNRIFPINEFLALMGFLLALHLIVIGIRVLIFLFNLLLALISAILQLLAKVF